MKALPSLEQFAQQIIVSLKITFKGKLIVLTPSISLTSKNKKETLLDEGFYHRFIRE